MSSYVLECTLHMEETMERAIMAGSTYEWKKACTVLHQPYELSSADEL